LEEEPVLLRLGGIGLERIESLIGAVREAPSHETTPLSPGRLPKHYAPRTPLILTNAPESLDPKCGRTGCLAFSSKFDTNLYVAVELLSESGDLDEAASNLYAALQRLDKLNLDRILATPVINKGIGKAINDRLFRASKSK
jgi:L-threonylcarbamoyladenylate synthase